MNRSSKYSSERKKTQRKRRIQILSISKWIVLDSKCDKISVCLIYWVCLWRAFFHQSMRAKLRTVQLVAKSGFKFAFHLLKYSIGNVYNHRLIHYDKLFYLCELVAVDCRSSLSLSHHYTITQPSIQGGCCFFSSFCLSLWVCVCFCSLSSYAFVFCLAEKAERRDAIW